MLELTQARKRILAAIRPLGTEHVALREAATRIAASNVISPVDLPLFDNSAMDGYAVRAEDLAAATPARPICLTLSGEIAAGSFFDRELTAGNCVRLFTGSPLPRGANAVVMQEETTIDQNNSKSIWFSQPPKLWENIRLRGEDIKHGVVLI